MSVTADPITHDGQDRRYQMCECSKCGTVERCTPSNDFFRVAAKDGTYTESAPLVCTGCFYALIANRAVQS